jgi:hypothetical protein
MIETMFLSADQNNWPTEFEAAGLDVIPDPMVMRIADLFIGGRSFATKTNLDPDKVWEAIQRNVDGLIAFFHLLMTRDRIPLVDYEYTFDTTNFDALGKLAVALHPPIYGHLKEMAKLKLLTLNLSRIPVERREELARERVNEFEAVGYQWFPEPGAQFTGSDKVLGMLLLGGLIFGGYAQISGSDHVLQVSRGNLLLELTQTDDAPLWVGQQEAKLFSRLNDIVSRDARLSSRDIQLPPTILPFLIQQGVASPRHLLDEALNLREKDADFIAYRRCYRELRDAWTKGTHNEERERDVLDVTRELTKRYPPCKNSLDNRPVWSREIGIKATLGAEAGINGGTLVPSAKAAAKAEIEADFGKVLVTLPNWIRNWLVEAIQFRSHRKILLRMAVAQHSSDNLLLGLRKLWSQGRHDPPN